MCAFHRAPLTQINLNKRKETSQHGVQYEEVITSEIEVDIGSEWVGCRLFSRGVVSLVVFPPDCVEP